AASEEIAQVGGVEILAELGAGETDDAGGRTDDQRAGARGPGEGVGVGVLVAGDRDLGVNRVVAVAGGEDVLAPAVNVDGLAVVAEAGRRALDRRAGADEDGAGVANAAIGE